MKSKTPDQKVANIVPYGLRMQPDLKQRIEATARANNRSLNAEIVSRLEASLDMPEPEQAKGGWIAQVKDASGAGRMDVIEKRLANLETEVAALRVSRDK